MTRNIVMRALILVTVIVAVTVSAEETSKYVVVPRAGSSMLRRVVELTPAAAEELRRNPEVAYLQRLWDGRSVSAPALQNAAAPSRAVTSLEEAKWKTGLYAYDGSGNIKAVGADTYAYDSVGRLIRAVVNAQTQSYKYDWFGNLELSATVNPATNQLTDASYDSAGNLISGSSGAYRYDAIAMMTGHSPAGTNTTPSVPRRMIYTADDERIAIITTPGGGNQQTAKITVRDFHAKVLREFHRDDIATEWRRDYVYSEGHLVGGARQVPSGESGAGERHYHLDHLGSVRLITRGADAARISEAKFLPFGVEVDSSADEYANFKYSPLEPMKFTGHERDYYGVVNVANDAYLDYMHARYYAPVSGRFMSVDPTWSSADAGRPQTWNRYAYAENNPVLNKDPDGKATQAGVGAVIGGFVGLAVSGYKEIKRGANEPVTFMGSFRRVMGGVVGGAAAGALAATCGTCAVGTKIVIGAGAAGGGGVLNRFIAGEEQTPEAVMMDAAAGAVGTAAGEVLGGTLKVLTKSKVEQNKIGDWILRTEQQQQNLGHVRSATSGATRNQQMQSRLNAGTTAAGEAAQLATTKVIADVKDKPKKEQ